jgi:hypothetical protein
VQKKNLKANKEKKNNLKSKIKELEEMNIVDYLRHTKEEYYKKKKME